MDMKEFIEVVREVGLYLVVLNEVPGLERN